MDQLTAQLAQLNAQIAALMANPSADQDDIRRLMDEKEDIEEAIMKLREDYADGAQEVLSDIEKAMRDAQEAARDAANNAAA